MSSKKGNSKKSMADKKDWYLPNEKGKDALGPYTTEQLTERIKSGDLRWDQFVWSPSLKDDLWCRIFELKDFLSVLSSYPDTAIPKRHSRGLRAQRRQGQMDLKKIIKYDKENRYRRFPRVGFHADAIMHNQNHYCFATCNDISEKGLFIKTMDKGIFKSGEVITITLRNNEEIGTVTVKGAIIRISTALSEPGFGVFFIGLHPQIRLKIAKYVIKTIKSYKHRESDAVT
jgi:hypothetical protein